MSDAPPEPTTALYFLDAARTPEQRAYMEELEAAGICVFCPEHVAAHHRAPVEFSGEHWYVTRNDYPYVGTAAHYLIVPHRHVTSFEELPDAAGAELWAIKRRLREQLTPLATATVERSGDMRFNGGSVAHLHTHFVALDAAPAATVRFKVSAVGPDG
jgi:ATP adenylyltransferase